MDMSQTTSVEESPEQKVVTEKLIYFFGGGAAEGTARMRDQLGGKGAGLAEMTNAGIPVPPGFTISTDVCRDYMKSGAKALKGLDAEVRTQVKKLEKAVSRAFGDPEKPLLVSVRSGAEVSMPGMMD